MDGVTVVGRVVYKTGRHDVTGEIASEPSHALTAEAGYGVLWHCDNRHPLHDAPSAASETDASTHKRWYFILLVFISNLRF